MNLLALLILALPTPGDAQLENEVHSSFGTAVCGIGDANGDGVEDLLVSDGGISAAEFKFVAHAERGRVWLISGKDQAVLWTVISEHDDDGLGRRLSRLADLNGDGVDDYVVSTNDNRPGSAGYAVILCGRTGETIRKQVGQLEGECFGYSATGVGDLDADGMEDLAFYSEQEDANGSRWVSLLCASGRDGSTLFRVSKTAERGTVGTLPQGVGDVDGDGHDDFVISRYREIAPWVEVVSGKDGSALWSRRGSGRWNRHDAPFDLDGDGVREITVSHGNRVLFLSAADGSTVKTWERQVSGGLLALDDVDQDGFTDFLLPASGFVGSGSARLLSGKSGRALYAVHGAVPNTWHFGSRMAAMGDLNGDGVRDFAVAGDHITSRSRGKLWLFSGLDGYSLGVFMRKGDDVVPYAR